MNIVEQLKWRENCALCQKEMTVSILNNKLKHKEVEISSNYIKVIFSKNVSITFLNNGSIILDHYNYYLNNIIFVKKCSSCNNCINTTTWNSNDYNKNMYILLTETYINSLYLNLSLFYIECSIDYENMSYSSKIGAESIRFIKDSWFYHINADYLNNTTKIICGDLNKPIQKAMFYTVNLDLRNFKNKEQILNKINLYNVFS